MTASIDTKSPATSGQLAGLVTIVFGHFDSGIRLSMSGQYVVVSDVQPRSIAYQYGLRPGMIVTEAQGVTLIQMPQYIWPETEPTADPVTGRPTGRWWPTSG